MRIARNRILVFAHDASLYGASQSLLTILAGIQPTFDILVLLPYPGKVEKILQEHNIAYKVVKFPRAVADNTPGITFIDKCKMLYRFYRANNKAASQITTIIKEFQPQLVYTNTSVISIGSKLALKFKLPHVWHIREFGAADYNFLYLPSLNRIIQSIKAANKVIFISDALYKHWFKLGLNNAVVVPNGIVEAESIIEKQYPNGVINIGILGAIVPGKGQDVAIKAFSAFQKVYAESNLYIYGDVVDQNYFTDLQSICLQLSIADKVHFKAFEDDKEKVFSGLDLLLNCSKKEGFGRTIVEAMSRGIPVIANASGGVPEIIDDGETGLLYMATSIELEKKMIALLSDKHLYSRISANASKKAIKQYSTTGYIKTIETIFNDLIKAN